jgi:hypothetical protein
VVQAWTDALLGGEWHVMATAFFGLDPSLPLPLRALKISFEINRSFKVADVAGFIIGSSPLSLLFLLVNMPPATSLTK